MARNKKRFFKDFDEELTRLKRKKNAKKNKNKLKNKNYNIEDWDDLDVNNYYYEHE